MTKLFEQAVETVRSLPPETQDELACLLLQLVREDQPPVQLTPNEEAAFDESMQQAERGEFATDDALRAIWAKYEL